MATTTSTEMASVKVKKSKKEKSPVEVAQDTPELEPETVPEDDDGGVQLGDAVESPPKKRKREDPQAEELEINVDLPEPPSKKALRKAKKQKTTAPSTTDAASKTKTDAGDDEQNTAETTAEAAANPETVKRSDYGVWIGNLPFGATKPLLREFFITNASGVITDAIITRVHMPAPANAKATRTQIKPLNKGFAYVDFSSEEALKAAMLLSETSMGGRKVLIKNAKSFEGRPEKEQDGDAAGTKQSKMGKPPSKRIFVGNLSFDVTVADLRENFQKCGVVADVHMATFEDSGKCKGFAWVTFEELVAAEAAVRGWALISQEDSEDEEQQDGDEKDEADGDSNEKKKPTAKPKKQKKPRKWFVNRLQGRPMRCEFAEDPTTRYKKRFAKEAPDGADANGEQPAIEKVKSENSGQQKRRKKDTTDGIKPGAPTDPSMRRGKSAYREKNTGAAAPEARYRTGAITEATGKKMTF